MKDPPDLPDLAGSVYGVTYVALDFGQNVIFQPSVPPWFERKTLKNLHLITLVRLRNPDLKKSSSPTGYGVF